MAENDEQNEKLAEMHCIKGEEFLEKADYEKAIVEFKKAIELNKDYYDAIGNLGLAYFYLMDYVLAESYFLKYKDIIEKILGKEHSNYCALLNNLGSLYHNMGNYNTAEKYLLESKDITENVLGKEHPDYATSLNNLGLLYHDMKYYTSAEKYYIESKKIRERILGKDHACYTDSLINLGGLYNDMRDYDSAWKYYKESKEIIERVQGINNLGYAYLLNNIGSLYHDMGDYTLAKKYYLESKDIIEKIFGKEDPNNITLLKNLGRLYRDLKDYCLTEQCYLEAKNICEKYFGKENLKYAAIMNNLGGLYKSVENYNSAEKYFLESKNIYEKFLGRENLNYAEVINNLGVLYSSMGDYTLAEKFHLESRDITERIQGKEHPCYITSLNNLGTLYYTIGNYNLAEKYFLELKDLCKEHSRYVNSLFNLSELYKSMGAYDKALKLTQESNLLIKTNIIQILSLLSEQRRDEYWNRKIDFLEVSYSLSLLYSVPDECNCLNYDNTLFIKGLLLRTANTVREFIYNSGNNEIIEKFNKLEQLKQQISVLQQREETHKEYIQNLELEIETLDVYLTQVSAYYGDFKASLDTSWQEVQKSLQENEAAIEFVDFQIYDKKWTGIKQYAALVLRPNMEAPEWVPLCEECVLEGIFTKLAEQAALVKPEDRPKEQARILYDDLGTELYNAVWKPLEKTLENVKTVYYSPSGLLHKLSFDAIPAPDGKRLADIYGMNLVSSTREVIQRNKPSETDSGSAAVYGGLKYDVGDEVMKKEASKYTTNEKPANTELPKNITRSCNREGWNDLPHTVTEITSIRDQLIKNNIHAELYNHVKGNKESFKNLNRKKIRILHLATHGFFEEDIERDNEKRERLERIGGPKVVENPLLRSGLVLSGGNKAWKGNPVEGVENGILLADEIAQMNLLGAELVVLSACNTALGVIKNGEGVFGLQRAFKLAGAETLIMSLWAINDEFTAKFMVTFYENWLSGMGKREAFKGTQKVLRAEEKYSSPYYWAAFVMMD